MNSFGERFRITTFGESHGVGVGCVLDGVPSGLFIDEEFLSLEMARRRGGQNRYSTPRAESDSVEILSGIFDGRTTGAPLAMLIRNENQKSVAYENVKNLFRPGHADYTYFQKYGLRDYRGGGRSSARESAARVAGAAVAKMLLRELGILIYSGLFQVGSKITSVRDFEFAKESEIFALDPLLEMEFKREIDSAREAHDSIGGAVEVRASGVWAGLGEPLYHRLDSQLGSGFMGLNAVKAVEIGEGVHASSMRGSENNDAMCADGFLSNHSGGILGGISTGEEIVTRIYFKPTPSIFLSQKSLNEHGEEVECNLRGRHDPCVAVRGSVVCEAMMALVLADMVLLGLGNKIENLKKIYNKEAK